MEMSNLSDTPSSSQSSTARKQHILCIASTLGALFGFVCVILVATTISLVMGIKQTSKESPQLPLDQQFPGYFRSPEEQEVFVTRYRQSNLTERAPIGNYSASTCSSSTEITCPLSPADWTPIVIDEVYNACCHSRSRYISPAHMLDIENVWRTMATFNNKKQYFTTSECTLYHGEYFHMVVRSEPPCFRQVQGCTIPCRCTITKRPVTAVYVNSDGTYGISFFNINNCCKCINT